MTNREKYKQAFAPLHAKGTLFLEESRTRQARRKASMRRTAAACLCGLLILGGAGAAYAADLGGIQTRLTAWIRGEEIGGIVAVEEGEGLYTYRWDDGEGMEDQLTAFGYGKDADGNEAALSAAEVLEGASIGVEADEEGEIWLYYYEYRVDITEYMTDGTCQVALETDGGTVYFDVEDSGDGDYSLGASTETPDSAEDYIVVEPE
ncbi:MAG: hypothetical protein LUE23_00710 [Lachnospiraceae bacterium]|nr:hypothetical protein [Lachnospiraceae bacterium]